MATSSAPLQLLQGGIHSTVSLPEGSILISRFQCQRCFLVLASRKYVWCASSTIILRQHSTVYICLHIFLSIAFSFVYILPSGNLGGKSMNITWITCCCFVLRYFSLAIYLNHSSDGPSICQDSSIQRGTGRRCRLRVSPHRIDNIYIYTSTWKKVSM